MNINNKSLDSYTKDNFCKIFSFQSFNSATVEKEIHRHQFFQILLLKKGKIKHWIDFEMKEAEAPFISVLFPNQVHRMELNEEAEADVIMFDETVFCSSLLANELKEYNIDLQKRINHITDIPVNEWEEIQKFLKSILSIWPNINMIRKMQIKFMIKVILLKIIDMAPIVKPLENVDADLQVYLQFREFINAEFATQKKVQYYADKLGVSTKKLTSVCFKYTGHSPLEIIHEKLCIELKKAFVDDGLLLKEIAFQFGFSSQSALNKFIERQFGCSPQKWRIELEKSMMGKI